MWEELYRKHCAELLRYARGACRDREAAEDLTQETFLKALQNTAVLAELSASQRRAWLYRTLKNLLIDRCRHAAYEEQYLNRPAEDAVTEETGFAQAENAQLLRQLPPLDRTLFRMRYLEGYTSAELAQIFSMPPGTVRAKLLRSREKLKSALSEF